MNNSSSKSIMHSSMSSLISQYIQQTYVYSCTVWPRRAVLHKLFRWTFSHPKLFFFGGGLSPSPLLSPSTLSPSQIQLIQHTASTCGNTHTEFPPHTETYKNNPLPKHCHKVQQKQCLLAKRETRFRNCKHSPPHHFKLNHYIFFLFKQSHICLKQCSIQEKQNEINKKSISERWCHRYIQVTAKSLQTWWWRVH